MLAILALAAQADPGPLAPASDRPDADVLDAIVLVQQGSSVCAGALVSAEGLVATAYHCVASGGRPLVATYGGKRAVGQITRVDVATDLALVQVDAFAGQPWLQVAAEPVPVGSTIRAIGHPFGVRPPRGFMEGTLRWSMSEGIVAASGPSAIQVTAPVNPGNSGGPVVDEDWQVVGVVSRRLGGDGMGFAGQGTRLRAMVEDGSGRRMGVGGTFEVETLLMAYDGAGGSFSAGLRFSTVFRDRIAIGFAGSVPFSPKWDAVRFGQSAWSAVEGRIGLRQRFFRDSWTTRLEAYGGFMGVTTIQHRPQQGSPLRLQRDTELDLLVGGQLLIGSAGFDVGYVPDLGAVRTMILFRWPGVLFVY